MHQRLLIKPEQPLGKINALDQLRFLAAFLVLLNHFKGTPDLMSGTHGIVKTLYAWVQWGSWSVSVFLVLSAFLFTKNFMERGEEPYGIFIRKRFFRIVPIYLLVGVLLMTQTRGEWNVLDFLTFATFQVNTGNPMTGFGHENLPLGPIWTIGVEFQFYLMFPFIFAAFPPSERKNCFKLVGIILLMIIFRLLLSSWTLGPGAYYNTYHTLLGRFDQFLIWMLTAVVYLRVKQYLTVKNGLIILLITLSLASLYLRKFDPNAYPYNSLWFTIEGLLGAGIIIGLIATKGVPGRFGKILSELGAASYSIYLLHLPVGVIVMSSFSDVNFGIFAYYWVKVGCFVIVPTIAISLMTYHCIEKPFMALGASRKKNVSVAV